ncbi:MAG TPA: SpoIIE family protein phosphatase [Longimicrobiaceae bacterium]|nr:SpoIIE family protein phosphatase [Longimicrobiaceae bacterium]
MATRQDAPLALVVDDDPVIRLLLRRALEGFHCCSEILEAADGLAAQALLQERPEIDLVLTDILMPKLDGLGLLRWGREHAPRPVWIILSGLDTFGTAVEAIRLGAFDFLAKPPRLEELEVSVRNALERGRLLRERDRLYAELEEANQQLVSQVRQLEEKSELLRRDLQRAEVIQRALLPKIPPPIERCCVQAVYRPGHHVGGDLYDVVRLDERHLALYVADATGHGVTSAMLSVLFKQRLVLLDEQSGRPLPPAAVLGAVNRALTEAVIAPGLFLTAVYCVLDTVEGEATLASAGHPPVLHLRAGGEARLIRRTGPALGLTADARFGEERFPLEAGDRLLLYTDGLLQSGTAAESERLRQLLSLHPSSAEEVLAELLGEAQSARVKGEDPDDVTLLLDVQAGASHFDNGVAVSARPGAAGAPAPRSGVIFYGETEGSSWLALRGRGSWTHCDAFYETACGILAEGHPLVIDLSACEYLDSTCLGTIHELVGRGGVRLHGVQPSVRELFEELNMERVLASVREDGASPPELYPLASPTGEAEAGRLRILRAHEALSALSAPNRAKFQGVVETLRRHLESG